MHSSIYVRCVEKLNILSLGLFELRCDIIMLLQILRGTTIGLCDIKIAFMINQVNITGEHSYKLFKELSKLDLEKYIFCLWYHKCEEQFRQRCK